MYTLPGTTMGYKEQFLQCFKQVFYPQDCLEEHNNLYEIIYTSVNFFIIVKKR